MATQTSTIWTLGLVVAQHRTIKPTSDLFVVSACLGHELPPDERGRGSLTLRVGVSGHGRSIASFARETCEQVNINLCLEANVEYVIGVDGPFAIDLFGYYLPSEECQPSATTKSRLSSAKSSGLADDDEAESEDSTIVKESSRRKATDDMGTSATRKRKATEDAGNSTTRKRQAPYVVQKPDSDSDSESE